MRAKSRTASLIDTIIVAGAAPLLKASGYRKIARSFHAPADGLFKVVQFQTSPWNTPDSAQFTVNLNIVLPYFHEKWTGLSFPRNPGSAAPIITQRIGQLMAGKRDLWWEVTPTSNIQSISIQVGAALTEHGLPFLDQHSTCDSLVQEAERKVSLQRVAVNNDLRLAILLNFQGKHVQAARIVQEIAETNTHKPFAETISVIAKRLGL